MCLTTMDYLTDEDIVDVVSEDQCTIENLVLEVPEDLRPTKKKKSEISTLSLSPYPFLGLENFLSPFSFVT